MLPKKTHLGRDLLNTLLTGIIKILNYNCFDSESDKNLSFPFF